MWPTGPASAKRQPQSRARLTAVSNWQCGSLRLATRKLALMLAIYLLAALPFFFGGAVISLAFARLSDRVNVIYAADLLGAAGGCLILIPLLNNLGAVQLALGKVAEAEASWWRAIVMGRRLGADADRDLAATLQALSRLRLQWGDVAGAAALRGELLQILRSRHAPGSKMLETDIFEVAELQYRASKRGRSVQAEVRAVVDRIREELFYRGG